MTKRDVVSIALKVFGVILIAQTVISSVFYVQMVITAAQGNFSPKQSAGAMIASWICYLVISVVIGGYLVKNGDTLAGVLARDDAPIPAVDVKRDARSILALALVVYGVILIAGSVTGLLSHIAKTYLQASYTAQSQSGVSGALLGYALRDMWVAGRTETIRAILGLLMGFYLAVRGSNLAGLLCRRWDSGDAELEPEQP